MPKQITHEGQLGDLSILTEFLAAVQALGNRIGPLLVQLPPGLAFEAHRVERFFITLRKNFDGQIACEPRGRGWFGQQAEELLDGLEVARVAADPPVAIGAEQPGGWKGLCYFRLHGSPRRYHSVYRPEVLEKILDNLRRLSRSAEVWCIFDNTASGAATGNALEILEKLS
jgi:uncharacterized protein YecE (DUF72 family)